MNDSLKFSSWNIGGGILGESHQINGQSEISYHISFLKKYSPDILCLQECHSYKTNGKYDQADQIASNLGYSFYKSQPISDSHLNNDAFLSLSILSKFPINDLEYIQFPNPELTATGPNGQKWILFDKGLLISKIEFLGVQVSIINVHCFPLHYFNAEAMEPRFENIWAQLKDVLKKARIKGPSIAAIDLNYSNILAVLSEEISSNNYTNAIEGIPTTPKGVQQDFILYTNHFSNELSRVIPTKADHHYCELKLKFLRE